MKKDWVSIFLILIAILSLILAFIHVNPETAFCQYNGYEKNLQNGHTRTTDFQDNYGRWLHCCKNVMNIEHTDIIEDCKYLLYKKGGEK